MTLSNLEYFEGEKKQQAMLVHVYSEVDITTRWVCNNEQDRVPALEDSRSDGNTDMVFKKLGL